VPVLMVPRTGVRLLAYGSLTLASA
jgi:hypothetical protein